MPFSRGEGGSRNYRITDFCPDDDLIMTSLMLIKKIMSLTAIGDFKQNFIQNSQHSMYSYSL